MSEAALVHSERYSTQIDALVGQLAQAGVVARLWAGDASLWHPSVETQANIRRRLGWLALPADQAGSAALCDMNRPAVIVACGPAAAHARLWLAALGTVGPRDSVLLDTVDAAAVDAVLARVGPATRFVFVASDLSPEMLGLTQRVLASGRMGSAVVVTAPDSAYAAWFAAQHAADYLELPAGVTERWGALAAFAWLAAGNGRAAQGWLDAALGMRERCRSEAEPGLNPGLWLGAALASLAQGGRDKLVLLASPALAPLAEWIATFVAGSLAKHRRGFVPIVDEPLAAATDYGRDHLFVVLEPSGRPDAAQQARLAALAAAGQPVLRFTVDGAAGMLAEVVRWQVAVAVAATIIGVNPFDEPDTVAQRAAIARSLAEPGISARPTVAVADDARLADEWRQLLARRSGSFVALVPYVTLDRAAQTAVARLRAVLRSRGYATVLCEPLRDPMVATQLLHAGRPDGVILALAPTDGADDPQARLRVARLSTDLAAWRQDKRRVLLLDVGADVAAALLRLEELARASPA